ncbi:phage baseplate protein [Brevibacillus reuszeri]|uniref:phage baseplate protein n=1 Tax=Brevibacillus reuszeri TaxID=54915 RepID=UPI002896951B|nr:hypothetical protein [Brevibacillus reuszeri]
MATINGIYITVEDEQPDYQVDVTEQPVEENVNLVDHVQRKPQTLSLSGVIVGEDAAQTQEKIKQLMYAGTLVEYLGRVAFTGLITGFTTPRNYRIANGCNFSMTLKQISIAKASYTESLPAPIRAQAAPVISSGRKQSKSKGKGTTKKADKEKETVEKVKFKAGSPWAEGD